MSGFIKESTDKYYCEIVAGGYSSQVKSCRDYRKGETTNEEWFCGLSTEEKAKVFANATYSTALAPMEILALGKEFEQKKWEMWLKQPHHEKG